MNMPFAPQNILLGTISATDTEDMERVSAFLSGRKDSTPFHRPEWMRAITASCGHDWRYIVAENSAGDIAGLVPLHGIHSSLFGRALVSAGFAVGGGIVCDDEIIAAKLADAAWDCALRESYPTAELRGGQNPGPHWQNKDDVYAGFVCDLADDEESQLLAIPRKQRAEIRKGLKNELEIRVGKDSADLEDHYAVYAESVRNLGTPVFPKSLFAEVIANFDADCDILTVKADGRPVASVLSLYHNGAVMPYWGGGTWDARRLRANDVMYYALMNHAREKGCTLFDFGRSKVGTGAYSFKKNWGFDPKPLSYYVRTASGEPARDVNPMSPKYRMQVALWQRLPLQIANKIGPLISRGLG